MSTENGIVVIKKGREKPIIQQHPWIFSGAIERVEGNPTPGDIVTVTTLTGEFLAIGYWNPKSQIQVRILTWEDEAIDEAWWRRMLKRAFWSRLVNQKLYRGYITAFRLVNAESDYIPGLIVDYYDDWIVLQALTLGIDQRKEMLAELIASVWEEIRKDGNGEEFNQEYDSIKGIFERSDVDVRHKEGLQEHIGLLQGIEPPEYITIQEETTSYYIDVRHGHKTGFYLDQRANRREVLRLLADDFSPMLDENLKAQKIDEQHHILNLFSYTGAFGVIGLHSGFGLPGRVTNVDASREVLELAEKNFQLNFDNRQGADKLDYRDRVEFIQADVFDYLRDQAAEGNQWDVVVLDPPKFAQSAKQLEGAARGYKDINLNAFKCVKPGGYLMTFSCSGAVSADLFQKIVFGALADSGRQAQILKHLGPGDDHPVALTFPEGAYLKGLLLRVY